MEYVNEPEGEAPSADDRNEAGAEILFRAPLDERFERITRLARHALAVPVAAVFLVDDENRWIKSIAGWDVSDIPDEQALGTWAMDTDGPVIIPDLGKDERTRDLKFVTSEPHLKFYAAWPLLGELNWPIGSLAIFDVKSRNLSAREQQSLLDLAELAQRELATGVTVGNVDFSLTAKLSAARRENMVDPLTRLWNARGAHRLIQSSMDRSAITSRPFSLALFNVRDFRQINARCGVQSADYVLREIASRLVGTVRSEDLAFRIGTHEFLLLMHDVDAQTAEQIVERVQWALTERKITLESGTVTVGIETTCAAHDPNESATVEQLLQRLREKPAA